MIEWLRDAVMERGRARERRGPSTPAPRPAAPSPASATIRRAIVVDGRELPLVIRRLRHARRMTLRLAPDGSEARVSIPAWGRIGDAEAFARERAEWLARQIDALPARQALLPGATLPFRGTDLRIAWDPGAPRRPAVEGDAVIVGGPRTGMEQRLRRWIEGEALALASADLARYCERAGRPAPRLALSRAQRRWGSCAADGTIRINWRLAMAPDEVRRSVVAHEVAHLAHFDHSPAFRAELARIFDGDLAQADAWLKRHGRSLYVPFG